MGKEISMLDFLDILPEDIEELEGIFEIPHVAMEAKRNEIPNVEAICQNTL